MIRLRKVTFAAGVQPTVASGFAPPDRNATWIASDRCDLQIEGGWIALWTRGAKVPQLVPVQAIVQAEPLEVPKGFDPPKWPELA